MVRGLVASALVALCMSRCDAGRRLLISLFGPTYTPPAAAPAPAGIKLVDVAKGLTEPTDIQFPPGFPATMVVLEKPGTAKVLELVPGGLAKVQGSLFTVKVRDEGELGLLGLAFHPDFAKNGRFFVNDTPLEGKLRTRISEWRVTPAELGKKPATLTRVVLEVEQPYQNHNAGQLVFGPDGMLYIGLGDGGWMNDPQGHGQNRATLLGDMLRVDVNAAGKAYAVPPDNPFVGKEGMRGEIWAWGLRNPWRYTFDEKGRLIVADVGQDRWEEISIVEKGANMGWNVREGMHCLKEGCKAEGMVDPVHEYGRDDGTSITGGYVYLGERVPGLRGRYVFGDFTSGKVWSLKLPDKIERATDVKLLGTFQMLISTFGRDARGEVYVADFSRGTISMFAPK